MGTNDGQLNTHFRSRLSESVSLPSPQQQLMAVVNATADDAVVKITPFNTERLLKSSRSEPFK